MVGSQIDPATIANTHIRAHALEGQLFRSVLKEAVRARGVASWVIRRRDLYAQAAAVLKASEGEVKRSVTGLGGELGGPWRAEEKLAATAAWIVLASQFMKGVHCENG